MNRSLVPQWQTLTLALALAVGLSACMKNDFAVPDEKQEFKAGVRYNNKVDMILMVDNSSSMLQYQNKFASEVPAMINSLNSLGLDYHVAVVTTDMRTGGNGGRFIGSPAYLTKGTPNLVAALQSRVAVGQNGSDLERGLDSLRTVLQPSYLQGEGAGFFRDDAYLAMIILTNEDDYSSNSTDTFQQFFDQLKPAYNNNQKAWIMNFIGVVSIDGQCRTTADFKEAGLRYMSLSDASGGIKTSICESSLAQGVDNVRVRIVEILSEYPLKYPPKVDTILVTLNGAVVPMNSTDGWTYNAATNSVRFHGKYLPKAADTVNVNYSPAQGT